MADVEKISQQVVELFREKKATLSTAESLTAGMISAAVADVSGASAVLMGGVVSYDARVKRDVLGVNQVVIDGAGVVSEPCAIQMAAGVRKLMKTDISVSATGVAGPTGGTPENPVGTVWIGVSSSHGSFAKRFQFDGDRTSVRRQTVVAALSMALETLLEEF